MSFGVGFSKLLSGVKWTRHKLNFNRIAQGLSTQCSGGVAGEDGAGDSKGTCGGGGGGGEGKVIMSAGGGGGQNVVLGVHVSCSGSFELTAAASECDQRWGGMISRELNGLVGRLRTGRAILLPICVPADGGGSGGYVAGGTSGGGYTEPVSGGGVVVVCGLGAADAGYDTLEQLDVRREHVRAAVGAAVTLLLARGAGSVSVDGCGEPDASAEGAELAAWRFQEFKSCARRSVVTAVSLLPSEPAAGSAAAALWMEGVVRARAQNWARYLSDMPANKMTPVDLAQAALDALCPLGVKVEARDRAWIQTQDMQAVLAVARGSCEEPILLEASYDGPGSGSGPPVLLVAKGVTFDSGGLCLKRPAGMTDNRGSMAGAAVAVAALRALAELRAGVRLRLVVPLAENMISGQCMKVGDVVRALNGLSIQIEDTDMEGRLLMADALVYGQAVHKPGLVVDVATLTYGVGKATGGGAFGCFSNSEAAWRGVRAAGARSGDRPWRFPLWRYYSDQITNDVSVDLRNKGSSQATPCVGAAFLQNFICGDWTHWDIAGVGKLGHAPAPPYLDPRRMTGRPTRTLIHFLQDLGDVSTISSTAACKR